MTEPTVDWQSPDERFDPSFHLIPANPLAQRLGIEITGARVERVVGTMPVEGNTQPMGLLHGGASCVLAETLGSVGAALHAASLPRTTGATEDADAFAVVGLEINATHHRSGRTGVMTGVATPIHRGRTTTSHEIVVSDDSGRRVCTARLSCLIRLG